MRKLAALFIFTVLLSCNPTEVDPPAPVAEAPTTDYFPPITGSTWDTVSPVSLGWNTNNEQELFDYLNSKGTKSFIVLKKGRIVYEKYFNGQTASDVWIWFSAGKTLTAVTAGIAQQEGLLDINAKSSDYLGTGWTAMTLAQENAITVKHHLSMSTGLDETIDWACYTPSCFEYKADAGTRWAYHQGAYTILQDIISNATTTNFDDYFITKIQQTIGMDGEWFNLSSLHMYRSTARSMARFGLLMEHHGVWGETAILTDADYFSEMTNTSQDLNKSYGYLWWLNGKESFMSTADQTVYNSILIPNAPEDMYCALGYADQKIYVVPSKDLVIIRMGNDAGTPSLTSSAFDNVLWQKINQVITD